MIVRIKNREVTIDEKSLTLLESRVWHITDTGYLAWRGIKDGKKQTIRFHREVIGAKSNQIVDHINRNKLDNRLCNLRICTQRDNILNSDRVQFANYYYYDKSNRAWCIDNKSMGVRSIYFTQEQSAKEYVRRLISGLPADDIEQHERRKFVTLSLNRRNKVLAMMRQNCSVNHIADIIGCSPTSINRFLSGKTFVGKETRLHGANGQFIKTNKEQ